MQHTSIERRDTEPEFIGGALCLDFANTVEGTHQAPTEEHVASYADLIGFARSAGALTGPQEKRLSAEARRRPHIATEIYRRGIALREALARVFAAIASDASPRDEDVQVIGREAAEAQSHARLLRKGNAFEWDWPDDDASLERPLWPIARSAQELLTNERDRRALRECASDTCGWLFVDRSRSRSRRWCDMSGCGNRAKQRRFLQRQGARAHRSN